MPEQFFVTVSMRLWLRQRLEVSGSSNSFCNGIGTAVVAALVSPTNETTIVSGTAFASQLYSGTTEESAWMVLMI